MNNLKHIFIFKLVIGTSLLLIPIDSTWAQPNQTTFWLNGGLGISSLGSLGGNANISVHFDKFLLSLRSTVNSEKSGLFVGGDEFFDMGLLFGLAKSEQKQFFSIAIGIARVTGNHYIGEPGLFSDGHRVDITPVIGLPLEAQLFFRPTGFLGLGTYLYGNLNSEHSFSGITFCLQVGKLR